MLAYTVFDGDGFTIAVFLIFITAAISSMVALIGLFRKNPYTDKDITLSIANLVIFIIASIFAIAVYIGGMNQGAAKEQRHKALVELTDRYSIDILDTKISYNNDIEFSIEFISQIPKADTNHPQTCLADIVERDSHYFILKRTLKCRPARDDSVATPEDISRHG